MYAKNNIPVALFLALVAFAILLSFLGVIPSPDELLATVNKKYEQYGLLALFISTFVEGFMMIGMYYIGSIFIISTVILADGNIFTLAQLVFVVWAALSLISVANFTIGRYTKIYNQKARFSVPEKTSWRKFIYFLHPTLIAYYTYSLGRSKKSYRSLLPVSFFILVSGLTYGLIITVIHMLTTSILTFVILPIIFMALIAISKLGAK